jgi:phosphoribosylglycinamide formyltransferase-1
MMKVAVFASGGGSNFGALLARKATGDLHVEFSVLISNNSTAGACDRARAAGIPVVHLPPGRYSDPALYLRELSDVLARFRVELIVLAGYMKKLPPEIVRAFYNRIVNIHPGLLPAFGGAGMYGHHVHDAVIAYGAKVSGITVHFVDEEYDHGPVVLQETLKVLDADTPQTLAARVLELEHAHYWRAVDAIAQQRLSIQGRRVTGNV